MNIKTYSIVDESSNKVYVQLAHTWLAGFQDLKTIIHLHESGRDGPINFVKSSFKEKNIDVKPAPLNHLIIFSLSLSLSSLSLSLFGFNTSKLTVLQDDIHCIIYKRVF